MERTHQDSGVAALSTSMPPGPTEVIPEARIRTDPLGFLHEMKTSFGTFTRHRTGNWDVYLVNRPDLVRSVLREDRRLYVKTGTPDDMMLTPLLGKGLLTSEGEQWKRQRQLAQPAFERRRVHGFDTLMTDAAAERVERWEEALADGRPVRLDHELSSLTLTVVARAVLGAQIAGVGGRFGDAVDTVNRFMGHHEPMGEDAESVQARIEFGRATAFLERLVGLLIDGRRASGIRADDLLDRLLLADPPFEARELRDQVLTMLMAGHETTAKALTWTIFLLDRHPEFRDRLQAELKHVLGGRLPVADDLERLPLCRRAVQEAMRLYPPVWLISRRAVKDMTLGGHAVPAGALVCISPYVLHHDPDSWERPEAFEPDRFAPERSSGRDPFAYLPFSEGPRQCIGQSFAMLEAELVLATLCSRVRFRLVADHPVEPEALVTLRPRHGMLMTLSPLA